MFNIGDRVVWCGESGTLTTQAGYISWVSEEYPIYQMVSDDMSVITPVYESEISLLA